LQLGFVNVTNEIRGIQIGAINVIKKGGWLVAIPLINGSF
jgi:hypothetical protein